MGDIITQWLREKLGIIVNVHDEAFLKMVVNGQIIALLLRQYNIITEEQLKSIQLMTDSQLIASRVTMWLKTLDPSLEEDAVNCFVKCRLSSTVKLFYRLYLALKGKDQLHFAAQNMAKARMRSTNVRFQCSRVVEGVEDLAAFGPHPLSQPLQDNYNIIQWHKDRYRELLQKCKEARNAYLASLDTQEKKPMDTFLRISLTSPKTPEVETFDAQSLCETYDELKEQEKKAQGMEIVTPNPKLAEKIVKRLKHKFKQDQEERAMKAQMETILVTKIWNEAVRQQEQDIEMELSKKILKQSMYEKKMASKIFEIREQKHIMAENRNLIQKEIQKQMDDALLEYVFVKEKQAGEERYRYYMERDRTLELHRRIYEEQQRLLRERRRTMCNDVVKDLVDMSIKEGEYKETFTEDMSPKMKKDLAALFVEGKSIFDVVEDIETIIDYVPLMDYDDEIMLEEIDRQNTVDIRNFEDYCNFLWPYEIEQHAPDFLEDLDTITLGMNILGHIIFRLLLAKYPKPPLPTPPDIPKVEAAVCISNIPDFTILPTLEKLLQERKIRVIQLEEAINYCLDAYKNEITTEAPESQFVDETQAAMKEVKKKKGAKEKKRKKDPPAKGQKPSKKKGKQKKKGESYVEAEEAPPFRDEMIETPRIFPCEEQQLSQKADLGRLAYEVLNLGEPLSDEILVKMFVEYLKTLRDVYGWVLVNYPQNFPQAMLLEEALTAKKVPVSQSKTLEPKNIEVASEGITELTTGDFAEEEEEIIETIVGTVSDMDERTTTYSATAMLQTQTQSKSDRKSVSFPNEPIPHPEPQTELILSVEISTVNTAGTKIEDLAELTIRTVKQNTIDSDKNAEFRVSLLLTNPDVIPPEEDYDSYLTALIVLKQDVESLANPHVVDMDNEDSDSLTPLDIFYQNQGCYYTLYYKTLDFSAIKHLGKLIVGEYSIPPKSSVQIFGDTVLYLEADVIQPDTANETKALKKGKKKEKKEKPKATSPKDDKSKEGDKKKGKEKSDKKSKKDKKEKKEKKDKGGDGDKKSKKDKGSKKGKKGKIKEGAEVMIERADKQTQIPTPEPESVVEFIEIPEPVPGTKEYVYVDLPIPDFFEICLATLWENVEEVYVYDFRELFFRKRLVWGAVVPYMDFVRRYMTDYIARPDEKQIHIFNFQRIYNSIDEDLRGDDEMKSELHCRVYEFREKLWEICDQRMRDAENERNNIIVQDWLAKQACELTSIYVTSMQLEVDRCADTMQLLNDYYTVMVTKMPCQAEILEKTLLHQVCLSAYMDFDDAVTYKEFVRNMLKDCDFALEETPYHNAIGKDLSAALEFANTYEDTSKKEIAKIEATVYPGKKAKPMKDTKQVKNEKRWPKFTDPEPEVREQGPKLVVEWRAVITAEKLRTDLRLNMLMSLFKEDLRDMFNCGIKTFHGLYNDVKDRYERELKSVEVCCSVLSRAIEEEVPIQPQLVLKGDTFYIDPNVMLFEDPLPMEEEIIVEYEQPETFTINQLEKFVTTLTKYAPKGIIAEQAFLFMLQDMIVYTPEDGGISAVPELWKKLSYKSMNKLAYEFFGYTAKIDWRDFVLYNLCISFPTEEELMNTRRQFRELDEDSKEYVFDYQYDSVDFWYEKEFDKTNPQDLNRLNKIKKILFKMYLLDNERVNYTMLLLGFCKGTTTPEGVAKALALSLGKLVCHQQDIGEAFVETLREQKRLEMEEELLFQIKEKEKLDTVASVIDSLIDTTVHECDSCYLIELDANEPTKTKDPSEPQERVSLNDAFISESMDYLDRLVKSYGPVDMYEEEYYGGFLHEEFSNVEIGYEAYKNPPLVYYLLYDIIFTVMMASMPWRAEIADVGETSFRQELEKVYESTKNHEFDDVVLTHEFLNSVQFAELMNHINKFKIINPRKVIRGLLGETV